MNLSFKNSVVKRFIGIASAAAVISGVFPFSAVSALADSITASAGSLTITGESTGYTYEDNVLTITAGGSYTISGTTTADRIVVDASGADVEVTLDGVNIKTTDDSPFRADNGNVTLILKGDNYLDAADAYDDSNPNTVIGYAGLTKESASNTLKITSADGDGYTSGSLTAIGGDHGAGIGGGSYTDGNNITIAGGTVNAESGYHGAGIGGGFDGDGAGITISGGIVTATSTGSGSGIGGGYWGSGSDITISGGTVNVPEAGSTGIGNGENAVSGYDNITISGGIVNIEDESSGYAAAIGGGSSGVNGSITISGGYISISNARKYAAFIGGGYNNSGDLTVKISGGYFDLARDASTDYSIGLGRTLSTASETVEITGGYFAVGDTSAAAVYAKSVADGYVVMENKGSDRKTYPYYVISSSDVVTYDGDFIVTGDTGYTYADNVVTINSAGTYRVAMNYGVESTDTDKIVINAGENDEVNLEIYGLNITSSTAAPISADSGNLTLILDGDNYLTSTSGNYAALAKAASNNLKITSIDGDGSADDSLAAQGGTYSAGIGGSNTNDTRNTSNITIAGGTITASSGQYGAGIGAGRYGSAENITISGGIVTASSTDMGAGIGGGQASDGTSAASSITISGGTVSASSKMGAGIGGGYSSTGPSTASGITISGGVVTASSTSGAGIGSGGNSGSSTNGSSTASGITISGGTVTASSTNGDGIGCGSASNASAGDIKIYNSSVKASSVGAEVTNAAGEAVYLYEIPDTTAGNALIVDGAAIIESIVHHSSSDSSQYIYLTSDSLYAKSGDSYYLLTYNDDGTTTVTACGNKLEIPNAKVLSLFAELVNSGGTSLNAVVTADIDFSGYSDMIGSSTNPYAGTFDGGGYTITVGYNITSGKRNIGLFGYSDGGTIKNLTVDGYIDFTNAPDPGTDSEDSKAGYVQVGGVVGYITNGTISKVVSDVDITSSPTYQLHLAGGIAGSLYQYSTIDKCVYTGNFTAYKSYDALGGIVGYTYRYCTITNCANLGTLYATKGSTAPYLGGMLGYVNNKNFYGIQNCCNYGSVSADDETYCGAIVGYLRGASTNITNNCWLDTSAGKAFGKNGSSNTAPEANTAAEFESGEVSYLLNGSTSGGTTWYQNIDNGETADAYPVLDSSHGTVYTTALVYCPNCTEIGGYSNTSGKTAVADGCSDSEHSYVDYACQYCGSLQSTEPAKASDGYYEISNLFELAWFAQAVNANADTSKSSSDSNTTYNARLIADIDLDSVEWTPIGYTAAYNSNNYYKAYSYIGTFDGNGHVIKNMTVNIGSNGYGGLFGGAYNATIKNLGVADASVTSSGENIGGIIGRQDGGTLSNCYFTGTVNGSKYAGALTGWANGTIEYCYGSAAVSGSSYTYALFGTNSKEISTSNCYYDTSKTSLSDSRGTGCGADDFAGGETAYLLNGSTSGGAVWYQNIDNGETADAYPVLDSSHGAVYTTVIVYCPSCSVIDGYSNTDGKTTVADGCSADEHSYVDYVCQYCGGLQSAVPTQASDGYYEISNLPELVGFAEMVNANADTSKSSSDSNTAYNARLTADIDLGSIEWTPIGYTAAYNSNNHYKAYSYTGTFDGNEHVIKNMTVNIGSNGYGGLFGGAYNAEIKNLGVVDASVTGTGENIGGIIGRQEEGSLSYCYFTGTVNGVKLVGGLTGWSNGSAEYCYAGAEVSGSSYTYALFGTNDKDITVSNCYYDTSKTSLSDSYGTGYGSDDFAGGKIAYLLNGSTSGGTTWYQNIDNGKTADAYPVFDSSHGVVYCLTDYYYSADEKYDEYYSNYENITGKFTISSAEELAEFAKYVNSGNTAVSAVVTANIDFSGYDDMIGSETYPYAGIFDGGGYTIKIAYDMTAAANNVGLFSYVNGGTIRNVNIEGTIDFTNAPKGDQSDGGYANIGGIAGYLTYGTISNVVCDVDITSPTYPLHNAGGIVGRFYQYSTVDKCIYMGDMTANKSWDALGGIVGYTYQYCKITNCANIGNIYATTGTNAPYLGGILGYINNTTLYAVQNCYNYGSVNADDTTYCGAIVGWLRKSAQIVTNNYWLEGSAEKAFGTNGEDGTEPTANTEPTASTADDFAGGMIAYLLNDGGTIWTQTLGTDLYPVFDGETVYSTVCGYSNNENNGDVWNDGTVDKIDAAAVLKYISGIYTADNENLDLSAADVNSDGAVNILDSTAILKALESSE